MSNKKILVNETRFNIKICRLEANLTQEELGKRLNKSRIWVNFREKGQRNLYLEDLIKISEVLNKPLWRFFLREDLSFWSADQYQEFVEILVHSYSQFVKKYHKEMSSYKEKRQGLCQSGITDPHIQEFCLMIINCPEKTLQKVIKFMETIKRDFSS